MKPEELAIFIMFFSFVGTAIHIMLWSGNWFLFIVALITVLFLGIETYSLLFAGSL